MISIYWTRGRVTGVMTFATEAAVNRMIANFAPEVRYTVVDGYHG